MSEIWALYDAERRPLGRVMRRGAVCGMMRTAPGAPRTG